MAFRATVTIRVLARRLASAEAADVNIQSLRFLSKGLDKTALELEAQSATAGITGPGAAAGRSFQTAIGVFRGGGKVIGFRAGLLSLYYLESIGIPLDAVVPHLAGLKDKLKYWLVMPFRNIWGGFCPQTFPDEHVLKCKTGYVWPGANSANTGMF